MAARRPPTLWLEVEETLRHFDAGAQSTGIPRVALAIAEALNAVHPERLGFFRITRRPGLFEAVSYAQLAAHCSSSTFLDSSGCGRLPAGLARQAALYAKRAGSRAIRDITASLAGARCHPEFEPGDWVLVLGASWQNRHYAAQLNRMSARFSIRIAVLIHDIIPLDFPQYCTLHARNRFGRWFRAVATQSDLILTSSNYNLDALAQHSPLAPARRVQFGVAARHAAADRVSLQLPEKFALVVGTLEIRKNHIALVRAWRTLIERHGQERVPMLVFAGRMGWLVEPLKRALYDSNFLDGKIIVLKALTDEQLAEAYERCSFTLLPSFCEGWGLAVAESLRHAKLCIASRRTAIPEVGGDFVDYIDPDDESGIVSAVERVLFDSRHVAERTAYIRSRYRAPTWDDCARQILRTIDDFDGCQGADTADLSA